MCMTIEMSVKTGVLGFGALLIRNFFLSDSQLIKTVTENNGLLFPRWSEGCMITKLFGVLYSVKLFVINHLYV